MFFFKWKAGDASSTAIDHASSIDTTSCTW
jgi:hypothetical protein